MAVLSRLRALGRWVSDTTAERYAQVTLVALWLLAFIVVTGAAVRLTDSGLGCTDWPQCDRHRIVASLGDTHGMIEQVNRYITGLVCVAVVLAVLGSFRQAPRRRDLTWLSLGLVAGVVGQIVLGGIVVLLKLNPVLVQGHFILSMVLVADAVVLHHRAGRPAGASRPLVTSRVMNLGRAIVALAAVVIVTGTAVTGSGPHAGNVDAKRLPFTVHATARVHGAMLFGFLAAVVALAVLAHRERASAGVMASIRTLLFVLVLQAAVGYTQYFTGIPALLVGIHVLGATLVWVFTLRLLLGLSTPADGLRDSPHDDDGAGRDLVAQR